MLDAATLLTRLLAERSLIEAVFGDHPANDPTIAPHESFLVHGCGLLAETLHAMGAGPAVTLRHHGELLHAAVSLQGGYLDAEGWADRTTLCARWAAIVDAPVAELLLMPYDRSAEVHFRTSDAHFDARRSILERELDRRAPTLRAALRRT